MSAIRLPSRQEAGRSLGGILTILEGDKRGLDEIDSSLEGSLRSFLAYLWCWPAQTFLWMDVLRDMPDTRPDGAWGMVSFILSRAVCQTTCCPTTVSAEVTADSLEIACIS